MAFTSIPNRDAYAAVRGYVYQVNRTIQVWLTLDDNTSIELECGEDIDYVSHAFGPANETARSRLLEQVKHRTMSITLKSDSVLQAIVNFCSHRKNNPDEILKYRFFTNAKRGAEFPSTLHKGLPGLTLWEQICNGSIPPTEVSNAVQSLAGFFLSRPCPPGVSADHWENFRELLSDNDALLTVVQGMEWITAGPSAEDITEDVITALWKPEDGDDRQVATIRYKQLFYRVFRVISSPDRKLLRKEDLDHELTRTYGTPAAARLLRAVESQLASVEQRVLSLEQASAYTAQVVNSLVSNAQLPPTNLVAAQRIELTPPPIVANTVSRPEALLPCVAAIRNRAWIHLHGPVNSGKTQLAALQSAASRTVVWVSLPGQNKLSEANERLALARVQLASNYHLPPHSTWPEICRAMDDESLIVLDDLPQLIGSSTELERIIDVATAAAGEGRPVLSNGHHPLPEQILLRMGPDKCANCPAPPFTLQDVSSSLSAADAPEELRSGWLPSLIFDATNGNPLLATLAVYHLKASGWNVEPQALDEIRHGQFRESLDVQTTTRVVQSVDGNGRELLYRLSVPSYSYPRQLVGDVASIEPAVIRWGEHLSQLLGPWIQSVSQAGFSTSPLLKEIAKQNLPSTVLQQCHTASARHLLGREIDIQLGLAAVDHLLEAGEATGSLLVFAQLLLKCRDAGIPKPGPLLAKWSDNHLPEAADLNIKVLVRCLQLVVLSDCGRSIGFVIDDIDAMLSRAQELEAWALEYVTAIEALRASDVGVERALALIERSLELSSI